MRSSLVCLGTREQLGIARATTRRGEKKDKGWQEMKLEQA